MSFKIMKYTKEDNLKGWEDEVGDEVFLLVRYPSGDVDEPLNLATLYHALYDAFQCREGISEGDIVESPWGYLVCTGDCFSPWKRWVWNGPGYIDGAAVPFTNAEIKSMDMEIARK